MATADAFEAAASRPRAVAANAPAPRLAAASLLACLPPAYRAAAAVAEGHDVVTEPHAMVPAAALGILQQHFVEKADADARVALGFWGTKVAARATQVGMLTVLLLALGTWTGLPFLAGLTLVVSTVVGVSVIAIIVQRCVVKARLRLGGPQVDGLKALRPYLLQLELLLASSHHESELHLQLLRQTQRLIAMIDVTWAHLLREVFMNLKPPQITLISWFTAAVRKSPPGRGMIKWMRRRGLIAKVPPPRPGPLLATGAVLVAVPVAVPTAPMRPGPAAPDEQPRRR